MKLTYREACRQAIRDALLADARTFVMGENVGRYGGCYAVTKGRSKSSARIASSTRRSPRTASPASASAPRSPGCGRSSRS
jgi:hypothetical protein